MSIKLQILNKEIRIKILNGNWEKDLERIKSLPNRTFQKEEGNYWKVPRIDLEEIKSRFDLAEVFFSDMNSEREFSKKIILDRTPLEQQPKIGPEIIIPPTVHPLRPFQERFIRVNPKRHRLLCSGPCGSGKTLCSLERLKILDRIKEIGCERILVICPKRVKDNWGVWFRDTMGKDSIVYWAKTKKQRVKLQKEVVKYDVVICTYQTAKELHEALDLKYDHLIVDEIHLAQSPTTDRHKAVDFVNSQNPDAGFLGLSGTPIQDKPKDFWGPVYFTDPDIAGSYRSWKNRYEKVLQTGKRSYPKKDKNGDFVRDANGEIVYREIEIPLKVVHQNLDEMRSRVAPIFFRVSKEEAFDFEYPIENVYVNLEPAQERLYNQLREALIVDLGNKVLNLSQAMTRSLRLLQAAEGIFNFGGDGPSSKLDYCVDYIKELDELEGDERKCIFWSNFQPMSFQLYNKFPEKVVLFNGAMSDEENQLAVWSFNGVKDQIELNQFNEYVRILKRRGIEWVHAPGEAEIIAGVMNLLSSLGIDLHNHCHKQVITSFSLMPVVIEQTLARLIRLGQQSKFVSTQVLLANNTKESKFWKLVLTKQSILQKILDGGDSYDLNLTREILRTIVEDD